MEEQLSFPKKLFRKTFALGIDSGASCIKIVYTTEDHDNLYFNFARFCNNEYPEALNFIKRSCGDKLKPDEEIVTCGVTANEQVQAIQDTLGFRIKNSNELTQAVNGFRFLTKNLPMCEWAVTGRPEAAAAGLQQYRDISNVLEAFKDGQFKYSGHLSEMPNEPETPPMTLSYPLIMSLIGSGPVQFVVQEDGTYLFPNWSPFGGRAFLGLSNYICGKKLTFDDHLTMVKEGDHTKIDQMMSVMGGNPSDPMYGRWSGAKDITGHGFGHLVGGTGDVEVKDVVSSVLQTVIRAAIRESVMMATIHKASQVFYFGSLACCSDMIQDMITADYMYEGHGLIVNNKTHHYFVRCGSYLGDIGSLLDNLELVD